MRKNMVGILLVAVILACVFAAAADAQHSDRDAIRPLVKGSVTVRPDDMEITVYKDWAFVDVAQKNADGSWGASTSVLLRKQNGVWKVLVTGDPMDTHWKQYVDQMPTDVKRKYTEWVGSHF